MHFNAPQGYLGLGRRLLVRVGRAGRCLRRHEVRLVGTRVGGAVGRRLPLWILHVRLRARHAGPHGAGMDGLLLLSNNDLVYTTNPQEYIYYKYNMF